MIITLPSDSLLHHISSIFPSHVRISSHNTSHLLHTLFKYKNSSTSLFHVNSFVILKYLEKNKEKGRRKIKKKREIRRSEKKENKLWRYLLHLYHFHHHLYHFHIPYHPSSSTSFGSIIIISGTSFVFKKAFNHVIPLVIVVYLFFWPPHHIVSQR